MKGDPRIITALNARLAEELTAIQQYSAHLARVTSWGYDRLTAYIQERIDDERKHQQMLFDRIEFLEGIPDAGTINPLAVGRTVDVMHVNDRTAEADAIRKYNNTIALAVECGDDDTRRLLETILADETDHINDLEAQLTQIEQMGLPLYLSQQVRG